MLNLWRDSLMLKNKDFTLIELMIMISIIVILFTMVITALDKNRDNAVEMENCVQIESPTNKNIWKCDK